MRPIAMVGLFALALGACESASSEKIEAWKNTEKGPDKIETALRSANTPAHLRAEAAAALVDIGRPEKADEILGGLDANERLDILKTLVEIHIKGMSSPKLPKARDARDGLFGLRSYATPGDQKRVDAALLNSIEKDLVDGRFTGGRHSFEKMLSALDSAAGPMLVKLIGDAKTPYKGLTELLVKVCDEPTRNQGGKALLGRIASAQVDGPMWLSLGLLSGPAVTDFLAEKMRKGSAEEAVAAAKALQQSRFPGVLPLALKIAGDAKANPELRGEIFGVIEKIGGPEAEQGLVRIIAQDGNEVVRYRAHEAALEIGGAEAIVPALQAFSGKLAFKREDVVDFLVKDISRIGAKAKPQVLAALSSRAPLARMTAVLALAAPLPSNPKGHMGGPEDVGPLLKLADDRTTIKGFPKGQTIGSEARRVAELLQGRSG